jgi:CO/xanthine dehydrogenase FAD-binding subunit
MTEVFLPRSLAELWSYWRANPAAGLYAGGTDVLVQLPHLPAKPPALICLERLDALQGVEDAGPAVRIGAGCTFAALLGDALLQEHFPILLKAMSTLGSPLIRNAATIGGNICTASPAGDTLPPLYVLKAQVEVQSEPGSRCLPLQEFIIGPRQVNLLPGEILTSVILPKHAAFNRHHFEKVGQRQSLAIAVVSLAALLEVTQDGVVVQARLAWGSVGPGIVTCPGAENILIGKPLCREVLQEAAQAARRAVAPIDDVRASAAYRRLVAGNLLLRLLI